MLVVRGRLTRIGVDESFACSRSATVPLPPSCRTAPNCTSGDHRRRGHRDVQLPSAKTTTGLLSAEGFGNLPERLEIPEAQALRQSIGGNEIVQVGRVRLERRPQRRRGAFRHVGSAARIAPGQGKLTRINLFAGPDLGWTLRELDPEAVPAPATEPVAAEEGDPGPAGDAAQLAAALSRGSRRRAWG